VASLASCLAFYARGFLHHYGLADRVRVSARWTLKSQPMRISQIILEIDAPLLPEIYDQLRSVVQECTVHNTLTQVPQISLEISSGRLQQSPRKLKEGLIQRSTRCRGTALLL
jgi:putative redox protein